MLTENLVIGGIMMVVLVLLLACWKLARVVLFESLLHPLRKVVIRVDADNRIEVEEVVDHRKRETHREVPV